MRRGARPFGVVLDEAQNAFQSPISMEALQRYWDKESQRRFDEYRQSLIDFHAYRQALLERLSAT